MKKLFLLTLLGFFFFTSCEDEADSGTDLNSDDAKVLVDGTMSEMTTDIISLAESDGVEAMNDFVSLLNGNQVIIGRVSPKGWTKERLDLIAEYFIHGPASRTNTSGVTTFDSIKGLYEWNPDINDFDKAISDFFIIKFPTEGSNVNNAELKISELEFVTVIDEYDGFVDEYEVPSKIVGDLKVDDVAVIELFFLVDWSSNGLPEKAEVELFVTPFTFLLNFNDAITKSSLLTSIRIDEEVITEIDVDVTFEDETKEGVLLVEGSVQYRTLKISGSVDPRDIPMDGDPNAYIKLALFAGDDKLGDIVFDFEEEVGDYVPYVVYNDGSRDLLEEILEEVFVEIEDILADWE